MVWLNIAEYSHVQSSADPLDQSTTSAANGTPTVGPITPTKGNELVTCLTWILTNPGAVGTNVAWIKTDYDNANGAYSVVNEYIVQTTATAVTGTITPNGGGNYACVISSFLQASGTPQTDVIFASDNS